MNALPSHTEIVIVGAGPSGLALAAELRRLGATPLLLDRQAEGANTSRAAVVHAQTLQVLRPLGATAALLVEGVKVPIFRIHDRDKVLLEIDFSGLDTPYPFTIMCPQNRTEAILLDRLRALGGEVERPVEVVALEAQSNGVDLTIKRDGRSDAIRTNWLVGCDGAHSVARDAAGVAFEGGAYEESFVLADVRMDWPLSREEVSLFFSPAGLVVVAPLPDERYRIVATIDKAPEQPDISFLQRILDSRGPASAGSTIQEIVWSSRFHLQHRVTATPRAGRILLCGDAAHVHSPAGGQGMNTGIQDAVSLASPLLDAVHGGATTALDAWASRRHEIAQNVVTMTDRMTRAATLRSAPARLLRNTALEIAGHIPGVPARLARLLAELDNR
ncbi:NAD(P)/FAD-dependent oxidoreductase [Mesorhizobium sp. INR15]|uniref:FAD-dependent oxidoreductase n=1 Tax=Mesorhizobium sp. INR15 TaxID=2654248 RepID=UPI001896A368|nr:NAD(P)/FAD-dependent oxidoreductase [Mesorhizobium sp. INR15]QPC95844.1 NAD(P)-binding protein [Mesorhizobium sp. INR15]